MAKAGKLTYKTRIDPATDQPYLPHERGKVFISYKKSDNRLSGVRDIVADKILSMVDCAVWYDENLTPGVDYHDEIQKAISECYAVVLLLTRDVLESDYIWNEEIPAARRQQKGIIPLAFDFPKELFGKVEEKAGERLQIIRWPNGTDADTNEELEAFDDAFMRALDRFVISTDRSQRIHAFFQSNSTLPPLVHITPYDRYLMGCAYLEGICTEKDEEKGEVLLDSVANFFAADKDSVELRRDAANALFRHCFDKGDLTNARRMAKLGTSLGDAELTYRLGMMHRTGKGAGRDLDKAAELFSAAAAQEHPRAMCALGLMYCSGDSVAQNKQTAFELFSRAAQRGNGEAMQQLADMYSAGDGIEVNHALAEEWYVRSARLNGPLAMRQLGKKYEDGDGVEKDMSKAFSLYFESAKLGDAISMRNLGDMYRRGRYVARNKDQAFFWYFNASAVGNAVAMRNLGVMYYNGEGVERSVIEAEKWFAASVEHGGVQAMMRLGSMFLEDDDVKRDEAAAKKWYAMAAQRGNERAAAMLERFDSGDLPQPKTFVPASRLTLQEDNEPEMPAAPVAESAPTPAATVSSPKPAPVKHQPAAPLTKKEIKAAQKAEKAALKAARAAEKAAAKEARKAARG